MDASAQPVFEIQNDLQIAAAQLLALLSQGEQAGHQQGWLSIAAVEAELGIKPDQLDQ